ncbi:MAG: Uma2 family endonuclease, partial [Saprospiraceae bacterium]|nr:Uma2 family endonuclease [Saprospiraceae bacterium]
MTTAAILEKTTTGKGHEGGPALISTEAFYRKYGQREDGYKYELVNGRIEKFKKT